MLCHSFPPDRREREERLSTKFVKIMDEAVKVTATSARIRMSKPKVSLRLPFRVAFFDDIMIK